MYMKKYVQLYTLTQKWAFFHAHLSICTSVCAFVHLWSRKVLNLPVCLRTSNRLVKLHLFVSIPGKCYSKRTTENTTLQEDACLVASFIQMNVFCVQDLQTIPQKTALSIKKLISEVASCRSLVEEGNSYGVWSQDLLFPLALPPAKCSSDSSHMRGNLSFWSTGLVSHISLTSGTLC